MASVLLNPEKTLELLKNDTLRETILNGSLKARIVTDVVMRSVSKEEFENFINVNLRQGVFKWIKKVFKV